MADRSQPRASTGRRRLRVLLVAIAVPGLLALVGQVATAQQRPAGAPPRAHAAARPAPPRQPPPAREAGAPAATATTAGGLAATASPVAPSAPSTAGGDAGAGVVEAKRLDGGTQVFKFSELDIEGRLKSPQLVYFLRRVRAEFSAGDLGHRTFMREMSETRKESTF
jgi:hypothetical protein